MNNSKPPVSYTFARGSIMYFSWVAYIAGTFLLVCTLFNIPPYIDFGDDLIIGFDEYKAGIPVEGQVTTFIPQTSIARSNGKQKKVTNIYPASLKDSGTTEPAALPSYADTISVQYTNKVESSGRDIPIPAASVDSMTFYVQPPKYFQKLLLTLPSILLFFVIGFCCRQVAKMLDTIQQGKSFTESNYKRIRNIGWLIIGYQAVLFITGLIKYWLFGDVTTTFYSSIPNYRPPLELIAEIESDFNLLWLVAGAMLLVVARTFTEGKELQRRENLTI